jgi:hypothetical protein
MYDRQVCQKLGRFAPEFDLTRRESRGSPARGAAGVHHEPDFESRLGEATDFVVS